jgi:hypothetical protein
VQSDRQPTATILAHRRSGPIPQPFRPYRGKAPELRYRPRLSKDRRSRRLRTRRPQSVGRSRHQDVNQGSRRRHRFSRKTACARSLRREGVALKHIFDSKLSAKKRRSFGSDRLDLFSRSPAYLVSRDAQVGVRFLHFAQFLTESLAFHVDGSNSSRRQTTAQRWPPPSMRKARKPGKDAWRVTRLVRRGRIVIAFPVQLG